MNLQIQSEVLDGTTILVPRGDVDLGSAPQLRSALSPLLDGGNPRLLLDLSGVGFMDSTGVGVMVNALNRVKEKGGAIAFCGVTPRVHRILQIAGLLRAMPLFEDRDAALSELEANDDNASEANS
jgi:anti-sigma B factor antagonist